MNEERARAEVYARSGGRCEICGAVATEWSHRLARKHGGPWCPTNGLHLDYRCHQQWLHGNPETAYAGGWHVQSGQDPTQVPVWLARPWPSWWLLTLADSGSHLAVPVDREASPVLPGWFRAA